MSCNCYPKPMNCCCCKCTCDCGSDCTTCEPNNNIIIQKCKGYGFDNNRCNCACPPAPRRRPWGGCGCGCGAPVPPAPGCGCGCGAPVPPVPGCGCGAPVFPPVPDCGCGDHNHNPGIQPRGLIGGPVTLPIFPDQECGCGFPGPTGPVGPFGPLPICIPQAQACGKCVVAQISNDILGEITTAATAYNQGCIDGIHPRTIGDFPATPGEGPGPVVMPNPCTQFITETVNGAAAAMSAELTFAVQEITVKYMALIDEMAVPQPPMPPVGPGCRPHHRPCRPYGGCGGGCPCGGGSKNATTWGRCY